MPGSLLSLCGGSKYDVLELQGRKMNILRPRREKRKRHKGDESHKGDATKADATKAMKKMPQRRNEISHKG